MLANIFFITGPFERINQEENLSKSIISRHYGGSFESSRSQMLRKHSSEGNLCRYKREVRQAGDLQQKKQSKLQSVLWILWSSVLRGIAALFASLWFSWLEGEMKAGSINPLSGSLNWSPCYNQPRGYAGETINVRSLLSWTQFKLHHLSGPVLHFHCQTFEILHFTDWT